MLWEQVLWILPLLSSHSIGSVQKNTDCLGSIGASWGALLYESTSLWTPSGMRVFNQASCEVQWCVRWTDLFPLSNALGQNEKWDLFWMAGRSLMLYGAENTLGCWRLGIYPVILQTMKILNSRSWHHFLGPVPLRNTAIALPTNTALQCSN